MKPKLRPQVSKDSLLRRVGSKQKIQRSDKQPLKADPEASMVWKKSTRENNEMLERGDKNNNTSQEKSAHSYYQNSKLSKMKRSSSKSLLEKHKALVESSSSYLEKRRSSSKKALERGYLREKSNSKSRLGDSQYKSMSKYYDSGVDGGRDASKEGSKSRKVYDKEKYISN